MAPKRPSPLDEPPAATSSEEEVETSSEEEEEAASGSGSEESESESESEPKKPASEKKTQPKKPESAAAKPHDSSSGETETESESESDADTLTQRKVNVKPISSKPMEEVTPPPKVTKPRTKVSATPATVKSGVKRGGGESEVSKDSKKAKKKGDEMKEDGVEEESKKSKLFQRIWSDEDEIIILKGMNEFKTKKGVDPYSDMNAFHDFIKKSLKIDVSKIQLQDKIRRLKKKFENNVKKKQKPSKPHDSKAFELSKKVWGGEEDEDLSGQVTIASFGKGEHARSNGKAKSNQKGSNKTLATLKAELLASPEPSKEAEKTEAFVKSGASDITMSESVGLDKGFKEFGLSEYVVKKGLELVDGANRAELEDRWIKLHRAELELFVQRAELMRDQAKLIVEAFNKSDH